MKHSSVFLPNMETTMDTSMMNSMLLLVLENFWERMLSSAIVESTRVVAR